MMIFDLSNKKNYIFRMDSVEDSFGADLEIQSYTVSRLQDNS